MICTLVIGFVVYAVLLWSHGTAITPDGQYYLAIGRGQQTPRPYCYRVLPLLVRSVLGWRLVHIASYGVALATLHTIGEAFGVNGTYTALAVLFLPAFRQSVAWPVLLDMPLLAAAGLCGAFCTVDPMLGMLVIVAAALVHERAPVWCAVFGAWFVPWYLVFVLGFVAITATLLWLFYNREQPKQVTGVAWLDTPFAAAMEKHRSTWNDWRVWLLPLGATTLGLANGGLWPWFALCIGWAGCLLAQDRARVYSLAAVPMALVALQIAGPYAVLIVLINWFVPNTEV